MRTLKNKQAAQIEYFGELSWENFINWLITFLLGGILVQTAFQMGAVRPESQALLQPLYIPLMALHGLSFAVSPREARRCNPVPLLLIPFLAWAFASLFFWTPTPWRGSYELSYFFTAFMFGWVAVNNVRSRAQLWVLVMIALIPLGKAIFVGYFQFFQKPTYLVDIATSVPIELNSRYIGQSTGLFADPGSFAALLLVFFPGFIIASLVPRLRFIIRFLCLYLALIIVVAVSLAQVYWAVVSVVVILGFVPFFCFEKKSRSSLVSILGVSLSMVVFFAMYFLNPLFKRGLANAFTSEGEGIRIVFWKEALDAFLQNPVFGTGAGSFSFVIEASQNVSLGKLPLTPHNDFLLVLSEFGLVGAFLLFAPLGYVLYRGLKQWRKEKFKLKTLEGDLMPTRKFFLAVAIGGVLGAVLCASFHFLIYVPALLLYAVFMGTLLANWAFPRSFMLPNSRLFGVLYLCVFSSVGILFWAQAFLVTESHALELQAKQGLEAINERGIPVSGEVDLVKDVIELYEDALIAEPENADAWIGLSMAVCQLHYHDPSNFEANGLRAVRAAERAYGICPEYWLASAQLGVAHALAGRVEEARTALLRALDLAPNVSNAHYYYAAFLAAEESMRDEALARVRRALEINPENSAARQLEQKLLIL